jgi:hypothetical protein
MLLRGEKKLSSNRRLEDVSHPAESSRFYCIRERSSRRSRQNILCCDPLSVMPSLPRPHSRETVSRIRHTTAFRPQCSVIPIKKARTIQLVPTPLDDGIQLGDADRKVRTIQLER